MLNGVARPGFVEFHNMMKQNYKNTEFFVYTASDALWAQIIIETYEKLFHVKFNRPLFTRTSCESTRHGYKKNTDMILPILRDIVKDRYTNVLNENLIIIDDHTELYRNVGGLRLVSCSTYRSLHYINYLNSFPQGLFFKYYKDICAILEWYMSMSFSKEAKTRHKTFITEYKRLYIHQKEFVGTVDSFWKQFHKSSVFIDLIHLAV